MPKLKAHFDEFANDEKFPLGPMVSPSPGPTLDIDVAAPDIEVIKSNPVNESIVVKQKKITI